jgi:hypothetical protein
MAGVVEWLLGSNQRLVACCLVPSKWDLSLDDYDKHRDVYREKLGLASSDDTERWSGPFIPSLERIHKIDAMAEKVKEKLISWVGNDDSATIERLCIFTCWELVYEHVWLNLFTEKVAIGILFQNVVPDGASSEITRVSTKSSVWQICNSDGVGCLEFDIADETVKNLSNGTTQAIPEFLQDFCVSASVWIDDNCEGMVKLNWKELLRSSIAENAPQLVMEVIEMQNYAQGNARARFSMNKVYLLEYVDVFLEGYREMLELRFGLCTPSVTKGRRERTMDEKNCVENKMRDVMTFVTQPAVLEKAKPNESNKKRERRCAKVVEDDDFSVEKTQRKSSKRDLENAVDAEEITDPKERTYNELKQDCLDRYKKHPQVVQRREMDESTPLEKDVVQQARIVIQKDFAERLRFGEYLFRFKQSRNSMSHRAMEKHFLNQLEENDSTDVQKLLKHASIGDHIKLFEFVEQFPLLKYTTRSYSQIREFAKVCYQGWFEQDKKEWNQGK